MYDEEENGLKHIPLLTPTISPPPPPLLPPAPKSHISEGEGSSRVLLAGTEYRKSQLVFLFQVTLVFLVVIVSMINLSLHQKPQSLWITLLSSSIGYLLPNPSMKIAQNGVERK